MQFTRKIILTLLIIVLCSALAFASDDSPSPEQAPLEVESFPDPWLSLESKTMELRAVERTITDVYNILNTGLMSGNNPKLDNIYEVISDCLEFYTDSPLQRYTIADLQGMTWQIANSINNQLTSTNLILGNLYNENYTTNRKLEYVFSAIEDTINIKWYDSTFRYVGASTQLNTNNLLSPGTFTDDVYFIFINDVHNSAPCLLRFFVPYQSYFNYTFPEVSLTQIYSTWYQQYLQFNDDYFLEYTNGGIYIYMFDFNHSYQNANLYFHLTAPANHGYNITDIAIRPQYIPFDTLDYQIIKTAFNQAKSAYSDKQSLDQLVQISAQLSALAQSSQSGSDAAEALADYFVSPQKQAAEDASQQVINSTLNNFTGSGSGAAKSSDSNAMKDVSGSLQSGLYAGGSVSGATGVFNSSGDFWKWFTLENSNYINNPYPAPVVTPTRGAGDEIVDFLTPNSNELQDLLRQGGDQR